MKFCLFILSSWCTVQGIVYQFIVFFFFFRFAFSEPKNLNRLQETGSVRRVTQLGNSYMDQSSNVNRKLDALRRRLTASLPDVNAHGFGSSMNQLQFPVIVFPDGYVMPSSKLYTFQNYVPRSWRIGGLLESWSNDGLAIAQIPALKTGGVFSLPPSGWATTLEDLNTLSLMKRLHTLRNLWREQAQANRRIGDTILAQQFFKNLPTTGISPDTARSYFHYEGSAPDTFRQLVVTNNRQIKEPTQKELLSPKDAATTKSRDSSLGLTPEGKQHQ